MAKKLTYVQVIRNIVESHIHSFVWENADKIAKLSDEGIKLNQLDDVIQFDADIEVSYNNYHVHGAVDEYGTPIITMIGYRRMCCTEKDENGEWITESAKPYTGLVYGEALNTFKFEK